MTSLAEVMNRPPIPTDLDKFSADHTASGGQDLVVVLPGEASPKGVPLQHPRTLEDKSRGVHVHIHTVLD